MTPVIAASSSIKASWPSRLYPGLLRSTGLGLACLFSYWVVTSLLSQVHTVSDADHILGGMWAVIASAFVFRLTSRESHRAALTRMSATTLSFALCLVYLLVLPFHPWGLALLIGIGALVLSVLGREDDIVVCSITTAVVLIVAALSPHDAWQQPILRFWDTVVGIVVGLGAAGLTGRLDRLNLP